MWTRLRRTPLVALIVLLGACSANRAGGAVSPRISSDMITKEQIESTGLTNLYDIVNAIHPTWLRNRSVNSFQNPTVVQVHLDEIRLGGVDNLRTISPQTVQYIRWYDPTSAASRWGLDHNQGAIYVSTRPE